jgi:hypothetical protein
MKKKYIKILALLSSFVIIWWWFYYYESKVDFKDLKFLSTTLLIRNNTWQTPFLDSVPYKRWEELEVDLIVKDKWLSDVKLNIENLKKKLKIKDIYLNDKKINENDKLSIKEWDKIKIIWEALDNWILKKDEGSINIELLDNKEDEKIEETQTWKLTTTSKEVYLEKNSINSNINNMIELTWSWKNFVEYVNIWWISLKPIENSWKVYLSIDKNTFTSWEYFVIAQFSDWELKTLEQKINVIFSNSKVNIANLTPQEIKNDVDRYIIAQWNGFSKVVSIQLNNNIILKNTSFDIINDNVIWIKIPKELTTWRYYINIMTTDWIYEIKNIYFNITN